MKYLAVVLLFLLGCSNNNTPNKNNFADEKLVHIYELQDQRDAQALIPFLKAKKESHRIAAALAFASMKDTVAIPYLSQMLQIDQDELPRRAAAQALGQIGHIKALQILKPAFDSELSKINQRYILEAIGKCGDESTLALFEQTNYQDPTLRSGWTYGVFRLSLKRHISDSLAERMLTTLEKNESEQDQILASHYVYRASRLGNIDSTRIQKIIDQATSNHVKERLSLIFKSPSNSGETFSKQWLIEYGKLNDYEKAEKISRIEELEGNASLFLHNVALTDSMPPMIRNAALQKFFDLFPKRKWEMVYKALNSGDMAMQSIACYQIHQTDKLVFDYDWASEPYFQKIFDACRSIRDSLELPREAETYIDVSKAIELLSTRFTYRSAPPFKYNPEYNHPINWELTKTIPSDQKVLIKTSKGDITLQCFVNDAPGTVTNFIALVDSGFYDGKFFHRVVSQFVIQGGCPRGDGWGSLDWSQRSEFSNYQEYSEGTVGIASSGMDTEGVQFFITHCPTPHLDGRYTIFARVTEGMDVVNSISVGDQIISIKRL